MFSPIHHTFGPHATFPYCIKAKLLILSPWKWKNGKDTEKIRTNLSYSMNGKCALFYSGREALFAILKSLNLSDNDEIIIQGYTCSVVPNAIRAAGGNPIFADIDINSLNLTKESTEEKITENTKAIICQHTFGLSADAESLRKLCDKKNIFLIEDCAHIIPDKNDKSKIGKYGDCAFFSLGRDKAISGITGGLVITRN
ncbi:MAG: aminotransferase class I/II-fold pyridoxal phosphate-dependent enzyme, partial [Candidatus Peribacteraceae bacterium]|nr:aminotransferase class I/II-fold pyridoxal phosphate-dependent enzyme [Candidatus Peribacteraceae bacterium]